MISTELMVATQSDQTQKWIMRAMPIMFVLFLFRFPAGLFVYWVTTNVWTIGQQLVIRRTMPKPEDLAARAKAKPKKRSRFMEVMMASQGEAMKQREQKMARRARAAATSKQGSVAAGKKPAPGGKKPPPGKVKRKQVQGGKPGQPAGAKPKSSGGQQGKPRPAGQQPKKTQPAGQAGRRRARQGRRRRSDHERGRSGGRVTPPGPPAPFHPTREQDRWKSRTTSSRSTKRKKRPSSPPSPAGPPSRRPSARRWSSLRKIVPYVNPADVEYVVVEEGSKGGLFGRGKMLAQGRGPAAPV